MWEQNASNQTLFPKPTSKEISLKIKLPASPSEDGGLFFLSHEEVDRLVRACFQSTKQSLVEDNLLDEDIRIGEEEVDTENNFVFYPAIIKVLVAEDPEVPFDFFSRLANALAEQDGVLAVD